ncbi:hypothetical protein HPB52_012370 [Rhipicephalus sanguineus]|uniref:Uncharacterized protein n=1 Tax=Rhipicephalus sanguineus TaxID=34632 RepID=A0A9D4PM92_RHISA|nr:hypothetical protein HPB52_012370 [Rhipicephalus sanguineus]
MSDEGRSGAPSHRTAKRGLAVVSRRPRRRSGLPTTKAGKTATVVPDSRAPGATSVDGEGAPSAASADRASGTAEDVSGSYAGESGGEATPYSGEEGSTPVTEISPFMESEQPFLQRHRGEAYVPPGWFKPRESGSSEEEFEEFEDVESSAEGSGSKGMSSTASPGTNFCVRAREMMPSPPGAPSPCDNFYGYVCFDLEHSRRDFLGVLRLQRKSDYHESVLAYRSAAPTGNATAMLAYAHQICAQFSHQQCSEPSTEKKKKKTRNREPRNLVTTAVTETSEDGRLTTEDLSDVDICATSTSVTSSIDDVMCGCACSLKISELTEQLDVVTARVRALESEVKKKAEEAGLIKCSLSKAERALEIAAQEGSQLEKRLSRKFSVECFQDSPDDMNFYTGLPDYKALMELFELPEENLPMIFSTKVHRAIQSDLADKSIRCIDDYLVFVDRRGINQKLVDVLVFREQGLAFACENPKNDKLQYLDLRLVFARIR